MRVLTFLFIIFAQTVLAQGSIKVTNGSGALLRTLDRLSGNVTDFKITEKLISCPTFISVTVNVRGGVEVSFIVTPEAGAAF